MKFGDLLGMSLSSLFKRKLRTVLTVLGVVIGVTSIVVMISLGVGMKQSMLADMESYGSLTAVTVRPGQGGGMGGTEQSGKKEELRLDDALVERLKELDHVESVDPMLNCSMIVKCNGYVGWIDLTGTKASYLEGGGIEVAEGRLPDDPNELEIFFGNQVLVQMQHEKTQKGYWETGELPKIDWMKDQVFVIFDTDAYYSAGSTDANGQVVAAPKKYIIKVAGVEKGGTEDWSQFSYSAYCDIDALKSQLSRVYRGRVIPGQPTRKNGKPYKELFYNSLIVNVDNMDNVSAVQTQINDLGYQTYAESEWIQQQMQSMNLIQAVLGGIGAVSLLVAAIGITNTMMMSIYERTKEIGIMKVIGCRIRDIQTLFLAEAGFIGFIGGVLGVGLSYLLSMTINKLTSGGAAEAMGMYLGDSAKLSVIPFWLALLSIVFAIVIAMLAGFFPSLRAMKLSPLAAIRAE